MEYLGSALIALAALLVVVIAAFSFQPANPLDPWLRMVKSYAAGTRAPKVAFADQDVQFGAKRSGLKNLAIAAKFDATIDEFGFWLTYKGPLPEDCPATVKIPGTHIRHVSSAGRQEVFEVFASPPIKIGLRGELADELQQRCSQRP